MKNDEIKNTIDLVKKEQCCGCHSCFNICPEKAIQMVSDKEGFLYPKVNRNRCIECGVCLNKCPAVNIPSSFSLNKVYACYAKEHGIHMHSSSGAIFALIASYVLSEGGVVCGATFDDDMQLFHLCITNIDELERLKKTKYVQSKIGDVFCEIQEYLKLQRTVLFAGTPCQVAGLKAFLGKEHRKLLTIDLICHGVPSPAVWEKYLYEIADGKKVIKMTFRNKENGIQNVTLDYQLSDGSIIKEEYGKSPYIKGFVANLYLRPSCYQCNFKGVERCSDITIGDFWGIKEYHPILYNKYGTSSVIVHSICGEKYFQKIVNQLNICEARLSEVATWNTCLLQSVERPTERNTFFTRWQSEKIADIVDGLEINKEFKLKKGFSLIIEKVKKWLA